MAENTPIPLRCGNDSERVHAPVFTRVSYSLLSTFLEEEHDIRREMSNLQLAEFSLD